MDETRIDTCTEKPGSGGPCALMETLHSLETWLIYYTPLSQEEIGLLDSAGAGGKVADLCRMLCRGAVSGCYGEEEAVHS